MADGESKCPAPGECSAREKRGWWDWMGHKDCPESKPIETYDAGGAKCCPLSTAASRRGCVPAPYGDGSCSLSWFRDTKQVLINWAADKFISDHGVQRRATRHPQPKPRRFCGSNYCCADLEFHAPEGISDPMTLQKQIEEDLRKNQAESPLKKLSAFDNANLLQIKSLKESYDKLVPTRQCQLAMPEPAGALKLMQRSQWTRSYANGINVAQGRYDLSEYDYDEAEMKRRVARKSGTSMTASDVKQLNDKVHHAWIGEVADSTKKEFAANHQALVEIGKGHRNTALWCSPTEEFNPFSATDWMDAAKEAFFSHAVLQDSPQWIRPSIAEEFWTNHIEPYMPAFLTKYEDTQLGGQQTDEGLEEIAFRGFGQRYIISVKHNLKGRKDHGIPADQIPPDAYYAMDLAHMQVYETRLGFDRYGAVAFFTKDKKAIAIWHCQYQQLVYPFKKRAREFSKEAKGQDAMDEQLLQAYYDWEHAKWTLKCTLIFWEGVPVHLGEVHWIVSGTMAQARRETLPDKHPLRQFLRPFSYAAIMINWAATTTLEGEKKAVHRRSGLTAEALDRILVGHPQHPVTGFKYGTFEDWVKEKKLPEADAADLPLVEDGRKLEKVIKDYVTEFVNIFWKDDAAVHRDKDEALNKFWDAVENYHGGGTTYGLPELSKNTLVDYLTHVIFTVSAIHEVCGNVAEYTTFSGASARIYTKERFIENGYRMQGAAYCRHRDKDTRCLKQIPKELYHIRNLPVWATDLVDLTGAAVVAGTTQLPMPQLLQNTGPKARKEIDAYEQQEGKLYEDMIQVGDATEIHYDLQDRRKTMGAKNAYNDFAAALKKLSKEIDQRNKDYPKKRFNTFNPKHLEISVSL